MVDMHITEVDAADPEKFAHAFKSASSSGSRLIIDPTKPAVPAAEVFTKPEPLHIAKGADVATYRAARAKAEAEGRELIMDPAPEPEPFVAPAGWVVIPREATHQQYKAMKADAESRGLNYMVHP